MTHHEMNRDRQECIDNCTQCSATCLETINHCLELGGKHASQSHIQLLQVCAEICQTSAKAMLIGFEGHAVICEACAEICERCAKECESMGDDETMQACAEICRRCATSCHMMSEERSQHSKSQQTSQPAH